VNAMNDDALNESLSALADGRATPADWARVNAAWDRDPALRERWASWHAVGDGLRSADLPALHREPQALLDALHAALPTPAVVRPRRRDWLAPVAVAAGFVAVAVGVSTLQVTPVAQEVAAFTPASASRSQALTGASFAQTASGRAMPAPGGLREAALTVDAPSEITGWPQGLPEPAASSPRP